MKKTQKALLISKIVFKAIWLAFAILFWVVGLLMFLSQRDIGEGFGGWLFWGGFCIFPCLIDVIKGVIDSAKQGWNDGANDYSASVSDTHVTVQNHPFRGAILGIISGIFGGLLIGPVLVVIKVLKAIIDIIKTIITLRKAA